MKPNKDAGTDTRNFVFQPNLQSTLPPHIDYGKMNEKDAQESGYTDQNGHAVSLAKKDKPGSPTGAYTDVGAGRSSVVQSEKSQKTIENAPKPREEQAP
jgi:hypothetical protein